MEDEEYEAAEFDGDSLAQEVGAVVGFGVGDWGAVGAKSGASCRAWRCVVPGPLRTARGEAPAG
jgi:hypothetical protein